MYGTVQVVIPNPDDILSPPIYEGPDSAAHRYLEPGVYNALKLDTSDIGSVDVRDHESVWCDPAPREF